MKPKFWMVMGQGDPVCRHASETSAREEAERLARLNPGQEFTVLQSVASVVKSDMRWELHERVSDMTDEERKEIPF